MAAITFQFTGDGIARMTMALEALAGPRRTAATRRALNHTGDKAYTIVKRTLAKQMGLPSQKVFKEGRALITRRASGASLEYQIVSSGKAIRAKEFRFNVTGKGVSFYPWGKRHFIKSAFVVGRFGGNIYRRRGPERFPLEALYGPNLNKELVKDATAAAFEATVATDLVPRIEHEVKVITSGVVS